MKIVGVEHIVQNIIPAERKELSNLERELLQRFKPKHREEVLQIMSSLRARYPKHNFDITLDNDKRLMVRAFGLDTPTIHAVKQRWYMTPIGFMRRVRGGFVDLFRKEHKEAVKESKNKRFVQQMLSTLA